MAFTLTSIVNTVVGDKRLFVGNLTATNITGTVTIPGAQVIDCILAFHPKSMVSLYCTAVNINVDASGTAANGQLGFSNVVSSTGANYHLAVLYH
jgi:hypothetical protein